MGWRALECMRAFSHPASIVVRESPASTRVGGIKGRSKRLCERVRYVSVPRERAYGHVQGERVADLSAVRRGHPRRRHHRVLRAESWGDRRGDRILVRECWVGPKESVRGGVKYRVALGESPD